MKIQRLTEHTSSFNLKSYNETEEYLQSLLDNEDFEGFKSFITELWNTDQDHTFFRLFINYDYNSGLLTKALFDAMRQSK